MTQPNMSDPQLQEQMRVFYDQVMGAFVQTYRALNNYIAEPTPETHVEASTALDKYEPFFKALCDDADGD